MAIDRADVDNACSTLHDHVSGQQQVRRNVECASEVVRRSHRNDAHRQTAFHYRDRRRGHRTVATAHDHKVGHVAQSHDVACYFRQCLERLEGDGNAAGLQPLDNRRRSTPRPAAPWD